MKKRVASTFLWFYVGWYCGAMLAAALGVSPILGPIIGISAGALIAIDPRHFVWDRDVTAVARRSRARLTQNAS